MSGIWVPWRAGSTAREQTARRANRPTRGRVSDKEARAKAIDARRKELFKQVRKGKITNEQYQKALRKLR